VGFLDSSSPIEQAERVRRLMNTKLVATLMRELFQSHAHRRTLC